MTPEHYDWVRMNSVFHYTDYRKFLRDAYEEGKARNKAYSQRFIAARVGFKSTGHFSQILSGKLNISTLFVDKLAAFFKLTKRQTEYFQNLVLFNQAREHEDKKRYFERLMSFREAVVRTVDASQYAYYDKWYNAVIRALLEFHPFKGGNYAELARMVLPAITADEAKRSVELLDRLGMVRKDDEGCYRPTDLVIDARPESRYVSLDSFVLSMLNLARDSIDRFPRNTRRLSSVTLGISREGYKAIVQELHEFINRAYAIAENDKAETVYQVNIQLFPVARTSPSQGRAA
jgi:uncharacterized protein (TIGR02147 family)